MMYRLGRMIGRVFPASATRPTEAQTRARELRKINRLAERDEAWGIFAMLWLFGGMMIFGGLFGAPGLIGHMALTLAVVFVLGIISALR